MDAETAFKRSTMIKNKINKEEKERKERWERIIKPEFIKKDTDECLKRINKACDNGFFNTVCDEYIDKKMFKERGFYINQLPEPDSGKVLGNIEYNISWK